MNQVKQLIDETKKYLRKYDYDKVIELCDKILQLEPESSFALRFKGIAYYQTGNYSEGLECYNKLYELSFDNYDTLYTLAYLNEKTGNYDEALGYYLELINNDYTNYKVNLKRKLLLFDLKRYDTLIDEYDEKINSPETYKSEILGLMEEKAVVLYRKKEYDEAYNLFRKISEYSLEVKKEKTNPLYHSYWYEQLPEYLDEYSDSKEFFRHFFKYKEGGMSWKSRVRRNLSSADEFIFADVLIEENPGDISLLEMYADDAKYYYTDYALKCFYKILEIEPENENAINSIIEIYSKEYSRDKALKFIDSKIEIPKYKLDLLIEKIKLLESMTLYEEALELYDEYFNSSIHKAPSNPLRIKDKLYCMEEYAIELYLENNLKKSFKMLKKVADLFNYTGKSIEYVEWYDKILLESIDKSEDNPEIFFNIFYNPDNEETKIWTQKIKYMHENLSKDKPLGNPDEYCDIILDKCPQNYEILLVKAHIYMHSTFKLSESPKKLEVYEKVLKIKPDNKEALNYKFQLLMYCREYDKAYELLHEIDIDYDISGHYINHLSDKYLNNHDFEKAAYCLKLLIENKFDYKLLSKIKLAWDKVNDTDSQLKCPYYMDWINLINHKHKECTCPDCGNRLIPIRYGVIFSNDLGFKNGKYYASDKINTLQKRPTDYCPKCEKEIYMGICGIDLTENDYQLADYTKEIIIYTIKYLEENPRTTLDETEKEVYDKFSLSHEEFGKYIEKLEEIGFIRIDKDYIRIWGGYIQFKNSIEEKYHLKTNIFKDKWELNEYSRTCNEFKDYENVQEYIEDIKISLMTSSWNYSYESATELLKGDEFDLMGAFENEIPADDIAMEEGFICG